MNFDDLQQTWDSPHNDFPSERQRHLARHFMQQMLRQRRFRTGWLICTFSGLTVATGIAVRSIATGRTNVESEWGLLPLLIAPWLFAFHFLRRHYKRVAPMARGEVSVADSLRAALIANRTEQSHLKKVGWLFAVIVPLLGLSAYQLYSVEKISSRELLSMAIFFGGVLSLSGAGILARYFGRVLPRQRQLDALLIELAHESR